ncbi:hypothetical protein TNCV_5018511 [Trichonephila clavipes]|nr:hypothetical protein TNCV_5018511 [Trichonephila clavipes]
MVCVDPRRLCGTVGLSLALYAHVRSLTPALVGGFSCCRKSTESLRNWKSRAKNRTVWNGILRKAEVPPWAIVPLRKGDKSPQHIRSPFPLE